MAEYIPDWILSWMESQSDADVVEVVRCKDCNHMVRMLNACYCTVWSGFNGYGEDGFCSYGEKREA